MRLALKAAMLTIVIFGAINYVTYLQTGRSPWFMWMEKTMARIARIKVDAGQALNSVNDLGTGHSSIEVVYKWTDADGVLQYTNVPPPQGANAEIVQVDPNANLIPAVIAPPSETKQVLPATAPMTVEKLPAGPPEQVKKTIDDARNAQQMMNERLEKQQQVLDGL